VELDWLVQWLAGWMAILIFIFAVLYWNNYLQISFRNQILNQILFSQMGMMKEGKCSVLSLVFTHIRIENGIRISHNAVRTKKSKWKPHFHKWNRNRKLLWISSLNVKLKKECNNWRFASASASASASTSDISNFTYHKWWRWNWS